MAKWGKFDFSEFEKFAQRLHKANKERVVERFIRDFLMEMAMRSLRKIKLRTPVGNYGTYTKVIARGKNKGQIRTYKKKGSHGKTGGQLRRSWEVGNVERRGDTYVVEIINNTEYAGFVEFGHRAGKDLTTWVEGRFMMTISMKEIERELPRYLEKRMAELLDNIMNGRPAKKGDDE